MIDECLLFVLIVKSFGFKNSYESLVIYIENQRDPYEYYIYIYEATRRFVGKLDDLL